MNNAALLGFSEVFSPHRPQNPTISRPDSRPPIPNPSSPSGLFPPRTETRGFIGEDQHLRPASGTSSTTNENPDGIFRRDSRRCGFGFLFCIFVFASATGIVHLHPGTDMDGTNRGPVGVDDTTPSRCPTSETNCWSWATVSMVYRYLWYLFGKA